MGMASVDIKDDSYHSLSLLNGIPVKISDKFKSPVKISLPIGWNPCDPGDLLNFKYDFSTEQTSIKLAEDEQLIKEQLEIEKVERLMQQEAASEAQDTHTDTLESDEEEEDYEYIQLANTTSESDILTPSIVQMVSPISNNNSIKTVIDIEEFEGTKNQNPFELVELQTLNELDELRSVLDPTQKRNPKKVIQSKQSSDNSNEEIDFSIFNIASSVQPDVTTPLYNVNCDTLVDTRSDSSVNLPQNNSTGTLTWTKFDDSALSFPSTNPFQPYMHELVNNNPSDVKAPLQHMFPEQFYNYRNPLRSPDIVQGLTDQTVNPVNREHSTGTLTRTKSLPNLQEQLQDDYENAELFSRQRKISGGFSSVSFNKSSEDLQLHHHQKENIPTDRINNIMKQFQFQRFDGAPEFSPPHTAGGSQSLVAVNSDVVAASNGTFNTMQTFNDTYPKQQNNTFLKNGEMNLENVLLNNRNTIETNRIPMNSGYTPNSQLMNHSEINPNFLPSSGPYFPNQNLAGYAPPYMNTNPFRNTGNIGLSTSQNGSTFLVQTTSAVSQSYSSGQYIPPSLTSVNSSGPARIQSKPLPYASQDSKGPMRMQSKPLPYPTEDSSGPMRIQSKPLPYQSEDTSGPMRIQSKLLPYPGEDSSGPMRIQSKQLPYPSEDSINISDKNKLPNYYYENIQLPNQQGYSSHQLGYVSAGLTSPHDKTYAISSFGSGRTDSTTTQMNYPRPSIQNLPMSSNTSLPSPNSPLSNTPTSTSSSITAAQPSTKKSWLIDETATLSSSEKTFAYQLNAMGFDLPCVSRAVKRLGKDEKEVLDFLCLVQEFKEQGHNPNDAEEALIHNENDKDKTTNYLKMVSMFRELGFQPKDVHQALKETSCDQNKTLDYLTK